MSDFQRFPSIPRLHREITITEKIDGTNGLIQIEERAFGESAVWDSSSFPDDIKVVFGPDGEDGLPDKEYWIKAGSRKRWIKPGDDNAGFAAWVWKNASGLVALGPGRHHGEWWGSGIQRGYGLPKGKKRFSLFNTKKWGQLAAEASAAREFLLGVPGLSAVPTILTADGSILNQSVTSAMHFLREMGSRAAPGFMNPEGVVIYHHALNGYFKVTFENDETGKGYGA